MLGRRTRTIMLTAAFIAVAVSVGGLVLLRLYQVGFEQQRQRVAEIASSRASFLSAVARFDRTRSADFPGGGAAATMQQLRESHADFPGFGETGEYLFARRDGDTIAFQVPLRHAPDGSLNRLLFDGSVAEPMKRALDGETGTMIGRDYRGEMVLAAYRPVPELDLGLVAKIDVAEIRAPYIRTSILAGLVGLVLILGSVTLVGAIGGRLFARLEESEAALRARQGELEDREAHLEEAQRLGRMGSWEGRVREGTTWWSDGMYTLLGLDPGEVEPSAAAFLDLVHPGDLRSVQEAFQKLAAGTVPDVEIEFRMDLGEGGVRRMWGAGRGAGRNGDGPDRILGLVKDITEERALEEMLRQSQKMEAVGQLTAGMAHDFNNLLTAILGNAELGLAMVDAPGDGEDDSRLPSNELEEIRAAARRGRDLVRQLMAFSRDRNVRLVGTDMVSLVRDVSELIRRALPESVEVTVVTASEPLMTRVDPGMVQQVLLNLANNARDAMAGGGELRIGVDRVEGASVDPGFEGVPLVRIRARDTGVGMAPEVLERAYEPFFTTKGVGEGTGLGLSMVYGLMKRQGGAVRIESQTGAGTTVSLYFRLDESQVSGEGATEQREPGDASRPGSRILLVEDEPAVRRTAQLILGRAGYEVLEAEDGMRALEILAEREQPVDLVVSDVVMPKMGGVELHRRCREDGLDVPFLFISGYTTVDLGVDDPGSAFLPKPWTADELLGAVEAGLGDEGSQQVLSPAAPRRR